MADMNRFLSRQTEERSGRLRLVPDEKLDRDSMAW